MQLHHLEAAKQPPDTPLQTYMRSLVERKHTHARDARDVRDSQSCCHTRKKNMARVSSYSFMYSMAGFRLWRRPESFRRPNACRGERSIFGEVGGAGREDVHHPSTYLSTNHMQTSNMSTGGKTRETQSFVSTIKRERHK